MAKHTHHPTSKSFLELGYEMGQTLGEGEFGKVKLGLQLSTNMQVAVKLFKRAKLDENLDKQAKLQKEISILSKLSHPSIIQLIEVLQSDLYIGLVLDYASGGELFDYILDKDYLSEIEAGRLFAQLMDGVHYLHSNCIVHRDLKLENLLLSHDHNLVIIDFGFANRFPEPVPDPEYTDPVPDRDYFMSTSCGSPCYAAPELVVTSGYTGTCVDIWSCGVILFAMLAGYLPFDDDPSNLGGDNIPALYTYILSIPTPLHIPSYLSNDVCNLLRIMIMPDPNLRATLPQILAHPWLAPWRRKKIDDVPEPTLLSLSETLSELERKVSVHSQTLNTRPPSPETLDTTRNSGPEHPATHQSSPHSIAVSQPPTIPIRSIPVMARHSLFGETASINDLQSTHSTDTHSPAHVPSPPPTLSIKDVPSPPPALSVKSIPQPASPFSRLRQYVSDKAHTAIASVVPAAPHDPQPATNPPVSDANIVDRSLPLQPSPPDHASIVADLITEISSTLNDNQMPPSTRNMQPIPVSDVPDTVSCTLSLPLEPTKLPATEPVSRPPVLNGLSIGDPLSPFLPFDNHDRHSLPQPIVQNLPTKMVNEETAGRATTEPAQQALPVSIPIHQETQELVSVLSTTIADPLAVTNHNQLPVPLAEKIVHPPILKSIAKHFSIFSLPDPAPPLEQPDSLPVSIQAKAEDKSAICPSDQDVLLSPKVKNDLTTRVDTANSSLIPPGTHVADTIPKDKSTIQEVSVDMQSQCPELNPLEIKRLPVLNASSVNKKPSDVPAVGLITHPPSVKSWPASLVMPIQPDSTGGSSVPSFYSMTSSPIVLPVKDTSSVLPVSLSSPAILALDTVVPPKTENNEHPPVLGVLSIDNQIFDSPFSLLDNIHQPMPSIEEIQPASSVGTQSVHVKDADMSLVPAVQSALTDVLIANKPALGNDPFLQAIPLTDQMACPPLLNVSTIDNQFSMLPPVNNYNQNLTIEKGCMPVKIQPIKEDNTAPVLVINNKSLSPVADVLGAQKEQLLSDSFARPPLLNVLTIGPPFGTFPDNNALSLVATSHQPLAKIQPIEMETGNTFSVPLVQSMPNSPVADVLVPKSKISAHTLELDQEPLPEKTNWRPPVLKVLSISNLFNGFSPSDKTVPLVGIHQSVSLPNKAPTIAENNNSTLSVQSETSSQIVKYSPINEETATSLPGKEISLDADVLSREDQKSILTIHSLEQTISQPKVLIRPEILNTLSCDRVASPTNCDQDAVPGAEKGQPSAEVLPIDLESSANSSAPSFYSMQSSPDANMYFATDPADGSVPDQDPQAVPDRSPVLDDVSISKLIDDSTQFLYDSILTPVTKPQLTLLADALHIVTDTDNSPLVPTSITGHAPLAARTLPVSGNNAISSMVPSPISKQAPASTSQPSPVKTEPAPLIGVLSARNQDTAPIIENRSVVSSVQNSQPTPSIDDVPIHQKTPGRSFLPSIKDLQSSPLTNILSLNDQPGFTQFADDPPQRSIPQTDKMEQSASPKVLPIEGQTLTSAFTPVKENHHLTSSVHASRPTPIDNVMHGNGGTGPVRSFLPSIRCIDSSPLTNILSLHNQPEFSQFPAADLHQQRIPGTDIIKCAPLADSGQPQRATERSQPTILSNVLSSRLDTTSVSSPPPLLGQSRHSAIARIALVEENRTGGSTYSPFEYNPTNTPLPNRSRQTALDHGQNLTSHPVLPTKTPVHPASIPLSQRTTTDSKPPPHLLSTLESNEELYGDLFTPLDQDPDILNLLGYNNKLFGSQNVTDQSSGNVPLIKNNHNDNEPLTQSTVQNYPDSPKNPRLNFLDELRLSMSKLKWRVAQGTDSMVSTFSKHTPSSTNTSLDTLSPSEYDPNNILPVPLIYSSSNVSMPEVTRPDHLFLDNQNKKSLAQSSSSPTLSTGVSPPNSVSNRRNFRTKLRPFWGNRRPSSKDVFTRTPDQDPLLPHDSDVSLYSSAVPPSRTRSQSAVSRRRGLYLNNDANEMIERSDIPFEPLQQADIDTCTEDRDASPDGDGDGTRVVNYEPHRRGRSLSDKIMGRNRLGETESLPPLPPVFSSFAPNMCAGPESKSFSSVALTTREPDVALFQVRQVLEELGTTVSGKGAESPQDPAAHLGPFVLKCKLKLGRRYGMTSARLKAELHALDAMDRGGEMDYYPVGLPSVGQVRSTVNSKASVPGSSSVSSSVPISSLLLMPASAYASESAEMAVEGTVASRSLTSGILPFGNDLLFSVEIVGLPDQQTWAIKFRRIKGSTVSYNQVKHIVLRKLSRLDSRNDGG